MKHWPVGAELPRVQQANHLRPSHVRAVQRFVHAFCLPLLDRRRARFSTEVMPQPITQEIVRRLEEELKTTGGTPVAR